MEDKIFRAHEWRSLTDCSPRLVSELIALGVVVPAISGCGQGSENLLDLGDVFTVMVYLALREQGVGTEVARDAAQFAHSIDMRAVLDSGESYLLILADSVPKRTFSREEARREVAKMVDGGQDVSRAVGVNLIITWGLLIDRVQAMAAATKAKKAAV